MTPDEIRALYVETLARIVYERTQRAMRYPMNMPPWSDPPGEPYDRDGLTVVQVGTFDPRRRYRVQAALDVDALAAAGLLPTGIEWGAGEVEDHTGDRVRTVPHDICESEAAARADATLNGEPVMRRFAHDWREVFG